METENIVDAIVPEATSDIVQAEMRYGIYSEKTAAVRAYWLGKVQPDRFPQWAGMPYPDFTA